MTPKEEVQELMRSLIPVARKMLEEHGEFYPYGGYIDKNEKIVHVGAKLDGTDHPASKPLIDLLREKMKEGVRRDAIRASGIIYDVRIKTPSSEERPDAIQVCLDHFSGYSIEVIFPYKILEDGKIIYGQNFAQKGDGAIFGDDKLFDKRANTPPGAAP